MPYYVIKPSLFMRKEPSSLSEVDSEAIFSEEVHLVSKEGVWAKITTAIDGYSGWVPIDAIYEREAYPPPERKHVVVNRCAAHLYHVPDTIYGPILTLPFESRLILNREHEDGRWLEVELPDRTQALIQRGDISFSLPLLNMQEMLLFSRRFLGLPYTWGGRSSFGYDCSGYIQMLYRQIGIYLPRNAQDQCQLLPFSQEISLKELLPGDLLFWGLNKDKIRHVGLYLEHDQFIHTAAAGENTPYLRISDLRDPTWNGTGIRPYVAARRLILRR